MTPQLFSIANIRDYLREFEAEFENILGYYSGAYRDNRFVKKTRGRKFREVFSLSETI
jgi:hypothetical protein